MPSPLCIVHSVLYAAVAAAHRSKEGGVQCGDFAATAAALLVGGLRPALRWADQIKCTTYDPPDVAAGEEHCTACGVRGCAWHPGAAADYKCGCVQEATCCLAGCGRRLAQAVSEAAACEFGVCCGAARPAPSAARPEAGAGCATRRLHFRVRSAAAAGIQLRGACAHAHAICSLHCRQGRRMQE